MTENFQPAPHLSPDQLSAFAENVLPEHERLAALTHLSACADCRQVVFLAQQAEPGLTAPAPASATPRRGWFTLPQIFGAATAALACSLILALIIHLRHTEIPSTPSVTTAKIETPPAPTPTSTPNTPPTAKFKSYIPIDPDPVLDIPPKPAQVQMAPPPQTFGAIGAGTATGQYFESRQKDKASLDAYSAPAASTYAALPPKTPAAIHGAMPAPAAAPQESRLRENYIAADSVAAPPPPPHHHHRHRHPHRPVQTWMLLPKPSMQPPSKTFPSAVAPC
jgi:hypothetical protein